MSVAAGEMQAPYKGFFAISPHKTLTIIPDEPVAGMVTMSYTDTLDELNDQMMYVPREILDAAVRQYIGERHAPV